MALFEDEEEIEVVVDEPNKYLDNPTLGVSLVKKMMNRYQGNGNAAALDSILDEKIFPILAELELEDGLDIYKKFKRIINRLKEQRKIEMIEGKKILGIGGKFSAGKSCFINSITHASLPEGQRPTTSIATYIMNSKKKNNLAKKFAILDDLKQIGKNISILLHFPQLIGKTIVGIDSLPPAKARDIYKILLSGDFDNVIQDESLVDKLRGTTGKITVSNLFPTIVSSEVQEISVLNTAENDVTLTNRQYVDLLSSSVNEQLDLSSLVHAAAIPGKIVESKGLIIFPEKNDDDKKYYQSLTECVDILVIQGKNCEIDRLKRYSNVKYIYIYCRKSIRG